MKGISFHEQFSRRAIVLATASPSAPFAAVLTDMRTHEEVVFSTSIRILKQLGWRQIDITAEEAARRTPFAQCQLIGGVLEAECVQLIRRAMGTTGERFYE